MNIDQTELAAGTAALMAVAALLTSMRAKGLLGENDIAMILGHAQNETMSAFPDDTIGQQAAGLLDSIARNFRSLQPSDDQ